MSFSVLLTKSIKVSDIKYFENNDIAIVKFWPFTCKISCSSSPAGPRAARIAPSAVASESNQSFLGNMFFHFLIPPWPGGHWRWAAWCCTSCWGWPHSPPGQGQRPSVTPGPETQCALRDPGPGCCHRCHYLWVRAPECTRGPVVRMSTILQDAVLLPNTAGECLVNCN